MKEKKILHITGMTSTKYGEYEHFLVDLIKHSNKLGYRSILQYESKPVSRDYLQDLNNLGAEIIICPVNSGFITVCFTVVRLIGKNYPAIIHTHFVERYGLFFIPIFGRIFGTKKIITTVNYQRWRKNNYLRFAFNIYDHVLACSVAVKEDLITRGVNKNILDVQYLGISREREISMELRWKLREEFGIPMQAVVLACIAFDAECKGIDVLLQALRNIIRNDNGLHLISIGVDPNQSKLPELVNRLGISQNVHWAGIIDNGWKILNAADIYVQPSRFSEGFGLAILEAMSMRLPVVCTKVGGMVEAVIDGLNGVVAEPNDIDSLAKALDYIIIQRPKWNDFGIAGYNRYREFFQGEKLRNDLVIKYYR